MTVVVDCSCGVVGCRELGWPHEWDPIRAGDSCMLGVLLALRVFVIGDPDPALVIFDASGVEEPLLDLPHLCREPYVRWGSGYACVVCAEAYGG